MTPNQSTSFSPRSNSLPPSVRSRTGQPSPPSIDSCGMDLHLPAAQPPSGEDRCAGAFFISSSITTTTTDGAASTSPPPSSLPPSLSSGSEGTFPVSDHHTPHATLPSSNPDNSSMVSLAEDRCAISAHPLAQCDVITPCDVPLPPSPHLEIPAECGLVCDMMEQTLREELLRPLLHEINM
jgi:hypothetical protein